jgi:branched-chain amino acid transport system substrate-binding protein
VAPLANHHGYPALEPTALSMKLLDMKLPYFFSMLPQPAGVDAGSLVQSRR